MLMYYTIIENGNEIRYLKTSLKQLKQAGPDIPFVLWDVRDLYEDIDDNFQIFHIQHLFVEHEQRLKGIATNMILKLINENPNALFVATSCLLKRVYPTEPTNKEFQDVLLSLHPFFEKLNFVDVNQDFGQYENMRSYFYKNDVYEQINKRLLIQKELRSKQ